jgi:hypothetical protein
MEILIALACCFVFYLMFRPKYINTEYKTVGVKIVDADYSDSHITPIMIGKTPSIQHHHEEYAITVEYDDVEYVFGDEDAYEKYHDRIGEQVIGTLRIRTYKNGRIKHDIIELS